MTADIFKDFLLPIVLPAVGSPVVFETLNQIAVTNVNLDISMMFGIGGALVTGFYKIGIRLGGIENRLGNAENDITALGKFIRSRSGGGGDGNGGGAGTA